MAKEIPVSDIKNLCYDEHHIVLTLQQDGFATANPGGIKDFTIYQVIKHSEILLYVLIESKFLSFSRVGSTNEEFVNPNELKAHIDHYELKDNMVNIIKTRAIFAIKLKNGNINISLANIHCNSTMDMGDIVLKSHTKTCTEFDPISELNNIKSGFMSFANKMRDHTSDKNKYSFSQNVIILTKLNVIMNELEMFESYCK